MASSAWAIAVCPGGPIARVFIWRAGISDKPSDHGFRL
jgi:hypothetical protein